MSDPDWIAAAIDDAYWSVDARRVYFTQKRAGSPLTDLHEISLSDGRDRVLAPADLPKSDGPPVFDLKRKRAAFVRNGDVFLREGSSPARQITRGLGDARALQFSADGARLIFKVSQDWYVAELSTGLTSLAAVLKTEKDPDDTEQDALKVLQLRTFSSLKRAADDKAAAQNEDLKLRSADPTRSRAPFYLGDVDIQTSSLSPDANWMVVVTTPRSFDRGRRAQVSHYVTESGYEEIETAGVRVGRNAPPSQSIWLLNLRDHSTHELNRDDLPGMKDDPLKAIREENSARYPSIQPQDQNAGKPRDIYVISVEPEVHTPEMVWRRDSKALVIEIFSLDNKDRWLASVDFDEFTLKPLHRLTDPAWVNYEHHNGFGYLNDDRTLWFESEESGYGHLYIKKPGMPPTAITQGEFEVSQPTLSADGRTFYFIANAKAPYSYDVYRVPSTGGKLERITYLDGVEGFSLDRADRQILIRHSGPYTPVQLAVADVERPGKVRALTDTRTAEYKAVDWIEPVIVQVPSSHHQRPIYGKLYRDPHAAGSSAPAVLFVHGAGYRQDVKLSYSYYFREQMFNNFLARKGYVVLDIDYRASQGYGREWRTAIYRQLGHPEIEDLLDAKKWLVTHANADPQRFGIYGGSYGGFLTLMALFRAPGEFKAGAALRPPSDWMQYDQPFTAPLLNDPKIDPLAYEISSPIEYASGLRDHLLICHGVIDNHVLFTDSMRLYQRLIELHKDNFSISPYALERHGFVEADSWLDEFKRIDRLFDEQIGTRRLAQRP